MSSEQPLCTFHKRLPTSSVSPIFKLSVPLPAIESSLAHLVDVELELTSPSTAAVKTRILCAYPTSVCHVLAQLLLFMVHPLCYAHVNLRSLCSCCMSVKLYPPLCRPVHAQAQCICQLYAGLNCTL